MNRLLRTYGRLKRRVVDWDLRQEDEAPYREACDGEVVILLLDEEGRLAIVRARGDPEERYILPMGRVEVGETIEEAAIREALEETGKRVRVEGVLALHRVRMHFRGWELERWYFVVRCLLVEDRGGPQDTREIEESRFVRLPGEMPLWWAQSENNWFLSVLKDGEVLHPHSFLLGNPNADSGPKGE